MVDINKRQTLKALCGSAVIAVASPGTTAASLHGNELAATAYQESMEDIIVPCLLYTSPSPRDGLLSRMPSSA